MRFFRGAPLATLTTSGPVTQSSDDAAAIFVFSLAAMPECFQMKLQVLQRLNLLIHVSDVGPYQLTHPRAILLRMIPKRQQLANFS